MPAAVYSAFESLYERTSIDGFGLVTKYGTVLGCLTAVDEFRSKHRIADPLTWVGKTAIYWRKSN